MLSPQPKSFVQIASIIEDVWNSQIQQVTVIIVVDESVIGYKPSDLVKQRVEDFELENKKIRIKIRIRIRIRIF